MPDTNEVLQQAIALLESTKALLGEINDRLDRIEKGMGAITPHADGLMSKKETALMFGVSERTIQEYKRLYWKRGTHYFPQDKGDRFNRELLLDWQKNRHDPNAHERAIDLWNYTQPGNQRKQRKQRA